MKAVNLLPSEHRGAPKATKAAPAGAPAGGSSFGAYAVLGALGLCLVMVAAYVLVGNSVKERQAELAQVQAEAQTVQAQAAALKPYADFRQLAVQRVATVQQLAESRFDWEQALRDISRALPADVHLKKLNGTVSSSVGSGSGSSLRGAVPGPAIELSGCTSTQSSVAKLMARLRAVRGVTRVSLASSQKTANATVAAPAPGAAPGTGPLCAKNGSPDFELVMFFERAAVSPPAVNAPAGGATPAPGEQPPAQPGQPAPGQEATQPGATTPAQDATTPAQPSTTGQTQGASAP